MLGILSVHEAPRSSRPGSSALSPDSGSLRPRQRQRRQRPRLLPRLDQPGDPAALRDGADRPPRRGHGRSRSAATRRRRWRGSRWRSTATASSPPAACRPAPGKRLKAVTSRPGPGTLRRRAGRHRPLHQPHRHPRAGALPGGRPDARLQQRDARPPTVAAHVFGTDPVPTAEVLPMTFGAAATASFGADPLGEDAEDRQRMGLRDRLRPHPPAPLPLSAAGDELPQRQLPGTERASGKRPSRPPAASTSSPTAAP